MRAEDLLQIRFTPTRLTRAGYDQAAVDDALDSVIIALKHYEQGGDRASAPTTSDAVRALTFPETRWREGYDTAEVGRTMVTAVETLAGYEQRAG
jgi:DivIVA domain-containing protein